MNTFVIARTTSAVDDLDDLDEDEDEDEDGPTEVVRTSLRVYSFAEERQLKQGYASEHNAQEKEPGIEPELAQTPKPRPVGSFRLPAFTKSVEDCTIEIRSDPQPCTQYYPATAFSTPRSEDASQSAGSVATGAPTASGKPFYPDPLSRVLVLTIHTGVRRRSGLLRRGMVRIEDMVHTLFVHTDGNYL